VERLVKLLFFVGLGVYFLIAVLARTPAEWGAWVALKSMPGMNLSGVSGSLWSGRAASAQIYIYGQMVDLGAVHWRLKPLSLLSLNACADLESQIATGYICHGISGNTTVSKAIVDQLPVRLFNPPGVQLGGSGSATLQHAVLARDGSLREMQGSVSWQQAGINVGTGWFNLGSFAADLTGNGEGGIRAKLQDIEGEFGVDVQVEFTPGKPISAAGTITPKANAPEPIKEALSAFTELQDDGSFKVAWPMGGG
jgi:general secretion pathway protein N